VPDAALAGASGQVQRIAPVVVLFPGRNGSAAAPIGGAPHDSPHGRAIGPGDRAGASLGQAPHELLASLDRSNPEHVRAVVEWLAQVPGSKPGARSA
jgi:hypothetical protein